MPYTYTAPLQDMRFVIEHVLDAPASWRACPALAELDADTAAAVLEEGARFAAGMLQPLNAPGDRQGARLVDGQVRMPEGFGAAYQAFVQGGWPALACSPEWGGQGLPLLLDAALREMLSACNHAWNMVPDLAHGAYETIQAHASEALKAAYLPGIVSGETTVAMALTEPQAGTDLGQLATRALQQSDGSLRIHGSKVFISGADHDMTEQIVHLVLCRLHDGDQPPPPGTRGISLALVPKWLPDGSRNRWQVDALEHKMGIHGSPTCALSYDGATGWLVGQAHRGLAAMFLMMNSARLHVGLQGLGHQEMAAQNALRYAHERVQMKQPIVRHPAVRHTLLRLQALCEAQRVLAYRAALALDEAAHHADAAQRGRAGQIAALLTPLVKAWLTEQGFAGASAALQAWGGYGYVQDYGIEQTLRDARIAMVYEGTNEIQAIDLLQRKLLGSAGPAFEALLDDLLGDAGDDAFGAALRAQAAQAREALAAVRERAGRDAEAPLRVADDFLAGCGHLLLAWAWCATARAAEPGDAWQAQRLDLARHGVTWVLPQAAVHWQRVRDGAALGGVSA